MKPQARWRASLIGALLTLCAWRSPAELDFLGNYSYGYVVSVAAYGDILYFGSSGTLIVARLDEEGRLETSNEYPLPNLVTSLLQYDHYLIAGGEFNARVFDIESPENPQLLGEIPIRFLDNAIITNDLLATGSWEPETSSIKIFRLQSDPFIATELSAWDSGGWPLALGIAQNILYYANDSGEPTDLNMVDITNPAEPKHLPPLTNLSRIEQITPHNQYLYLASPTDGLVTLDISNPTQPTVVGNINPHPGYSLSLEEGVLGFLAGGEFVSTLDFSTPGQPTVLNTMAPSSSVYKALLIGTDTMMPAGREGMYLGRLSLSGSLSITDHYRAPYLGYTVDVQGTTAYLGGDEGLTSFNVSDPRHPFPISHLPLPEPTTLIEVSGTVAAVATENYGDQGDQQLVFVDLSDADSMEIMSSYPLDDYPYRIRLKDGFAYVADRNGGLIIVDFTDPSHPTHVATFSGFVVDVFLQGDRAYVTDWTSHEVMILDISNPKTPVHLTTYTDPSLSPSGIVLDGSTAFILDLDGFWVVDFQDIFNPVLLSTYADGIGIFPILSGDILYTGWFYFLHFNISDPNNITFVGPATPLIGGFFSVENSKVYLPSIYGGLYIYRDLDSLTFSDGFETGDFSLWSEVQP